MIICPECHSKSDDFAHPCRVCGYFPETVDGFLAWAPELARSNSGFDAENFSGLASAEADHFWFRARNELILWALSRYFPNYSSLLEIGCGTGFVLAGIADKNPGSRLVGSEIYASGLSFASQRLRDVELVQMDARQLPYAEEFDVVGAFDVIEHIQEDELVINNIYQAIKPGGGCLITVPQHMWLWSAVDEQACHQRRYERKDLLQKMRSAGFEIVRCTSFVSSLLPAMALSRLLQKKSSQNVEDPTEGLKISPVLNAIFYGFLRSELSLIKRGINFPAGGSLLVVARKL